MASKKSREEAELLLSRAGVDPKKPVMEKKKSRLDGKDIDQRSAIQVLTNVYPVETKNIPIYRYDVLITAVYLRIDGVTEVRVELTKKRSGGDATQQDLYAKCREIFRKVRADDEMLKKHRLYYDLQSILYSLDKLEIPEDQAYKVIMPPEALNEKLFAGAIKVEVQIMKVTENFQLTLNDFTGVNQDLMQEDRSLLQFIDIATSQYAYFHEDIHVPFGSKRTYLMDPMQHGFRQEDMAEFHDNGAYLGIGVDKAAHWVEGPSRTKCFAMIVDSKKTAFHGCMPMIEKFKRLVRDYRQLRNGDFDKVKRILSGLEFTTTHLGPHRRFTVKSISYVGAREKKFESEEHGEVSVEEYFKKKYNIRLSEPTIPMIETRGPNFFPMELCHVADSQRVKTDQQTSQQVQEMIKKSAVPPAKHKDQIEKMFNAMNLKGSDYLREAQINVVPKPALVNGRVLPMPKLVYAQNAEARVNFSGQWQVMGNHFINPAGCKQWVAYAFLGPRDRLQIGEFNEFLNKYAQEARNRGMRIPPKPYRQPEIISASDNLKVLERLVKDAKRDGCDFFVMVHGDFDDNTHAYIKLVEQRYEIVTQEFRVSTITKVVQRNQWQTVQNVVYKSNCKMGGLNYTLFANNQTAKMIMGSDTLIIGLAVNHPSGGRKPIQMSDQASESASQAQAPLEKSAPSSVGFAANVGKCDEFEFVGDFIFQDYTGEIDINTTVQAVQKVLNLARSAGRKSPPKRVIIYRNECSDGWLSFILSYEVPMIKSVLAKAGCKDAKLTLIVASRLQSVRFFKDKIDPNAKPPEQNVPVGLVVDSTVVHPEFCEFFLNSHRALQGTARTPRYLVALDENNYQLDKLEEMTYQLCYGHQIVNMPTSLPSPVYIANRYAERGRKMFNSRMKEDKRGIDDFDAMTTELCYHKKEGLKQRRVNA